MTAPLLEIEGLEAWYGPAQALFGLSLVVGGGEAVALIGRNGAGKSTTLKAVMGLVRRRAGRLALDGADISALPTHHIARLGVGYVPEDRRIFTELTAEENLDLARRPGRDGTDRWPTERLFALFPNLAELRRRRGDAMSGGEQQMLAVARALVGNPELLLLDEPSEGVAPIIVEEMTTAFRTLKADGLSILLSEQNVALCAELCDRAYHIDQGELRWSGPMADASSMVE
ncbi:ABC transporter ATP-binding protein [Ancylobacter sp. Lp-2]|uniref:ABC transporter ATP-binding protein n=1 Tax=Ancylobacter sp. Lp-2 TaxID=2881339 RepID=UPI001E54F5B6|nr:ABC transporter ATP-binding protein [Ancylobacter sp. Lp-2]MCB4771441.1 ABC transporter ATP-binding protein [Ancylobacter sp. Lp-2]